MRKQNIKRHFSDKSLAEFGEQFLRGLMMRSLKVALSNGQRHLVSGFRGKSVFVVTKVYKDCIEQRSYLADELPEADRLKNPKFKHESTGAIVLGPDGSVTDATPPGDNIDGLLIGFVYPQLP
ncbi:MAG TPA: hypothetical protein VHS31_12085 [Tepidisphaeraceae bacterium]|jgi:hypothetical protein|nr:hypothetical protein [Tepidisphaeraceae bacterium]